MRTQSADLTTLPKNDYKDLQRITLVCQQEHFSKLQTLETKGPQDCSVKVFETAGFVSKNPEHPLTKHYFPYLTSSLFGRCVLYSPLISSTQTILKDELTDFVPDGTIFVADRQSKGKGRGEHVWTSPEGCLMFSFKCQLSNPKRLAFLQYLVSLVLINVLKKPIENRDLDVRIKWPNDIFTSDGKKLGGILCQSSYSHAGSFDITIGIGLNVDNDEPTTSINALLRSLTTNTIPFSRLTLLSHFASAFEKDFQTFITHGFEPFLGNYLQYWLHAKQSVELKTPLHTRKVVVQNISLETGYLIASDAEDNSVLYELHPDGHSLDWMQGLMVHKVLSTKTSSKVNL